MVSVKTINIIVREKLEALSAGLVYVLLVGLIAIGICFTVYVVFYTEYWYIGIIYLIWIWVIDKDTPEGVSRINYWVRSWTVFKYASNYFPVTVHTEPGANLEPNRNYLACCFPHGVMPTGVILAFHTEACSTKKLVPNHTIYGITLKGLFYIPVYRDFILSLGFCNANAKSIERILTHPGGGKIAGLIAGGSAEMFYSHSGEYKLVLKNRKGFIKLALKTGSPIIPLFSFGETSIYKQKVFPKGSLIRRIQEWVKASLGFPPILCYGRGLFQNTFGIIPFPTPIHIIVGKPLDVQKIENPTQEEIDALHKKFIETLTDLFEKYKGLYEPNPEKSKLIIC